MSFMQPQVQHGRWYEVETRCGTDIVPHEVVGDLPLPEGVEFKDGEEISLETLVAAVEEQFHQDHETACQTGEVAWGLVKEALKPYVGVTIESVVVTEGWGARLSAPGYMDCTDWSVFDTEEEAKAHLRDEEGEDPDTVWEVVVGNIGHVYQGRNEAEAREVFKEYVEQSKGGSGRAGGETVTLLKNCDTEEEHIPQQAEDES